MNQCSELPEGHDYHEDSIQIDGCACAIIAVEEGHIIYDYELLIRHFSDHENMRELDDYDQEDISAIEWIDYNVIRGIPYSGPGKLPDIRDGQYSLVNDEDEED